MKYRIVYTKGAIAMSVWTTSKEAAVKKAEALSRYGYTVNVWEYNGQSCHEIRNL